MTDAADRIEIMELLSRHQIAIDMRDADAYADVFAPKGKFSSPFASAEGSDALKDMTMALHRSGFTDGKRHYLGPIQVDIDGDEARAFSYWWVAETREPLAVFATGTYTDHLIRLEGRWRIVERRQDSDQVARPPAEETPPAISKADNGRNA